MLCIEGQLSFPGDKSLSHRYAIFSALSEGTTVIENFLPAEDTLHTLRAFEKLGVQIEYCLDKTRVVVRSLGISRWNLVEPIELYVGNSGTAARLLLGLFAGLPDAKVTINGDESLRLRPMARICNPLSDFGASFSNLNLLPITVEGCQLGSISYKEVLGSAQVKSALLLSAISSGVEITIAEEKPSRNHTELLLETLGCNIDVDSNENIITLSPPYSLKGGTFSVLGDISSAAFFIVLGLIADRGSLLVCNVLWNDFRNKFVEILIKMGGRITVVRESVLHGEKSVDLKVEPSELRGLEISEELIPAIIDELPILTIAGVFCRGTFSFRGAAELRKKESDRIHALVSNLARLGVKVQEYEDGLSLQGDPKAFLSGFVEVFHDHRIAMAFYIASLRSFYNGSSKRNPLVIGGLEWIQTSFPSFFEKLSSVLDTKASKAFLRKQVITLDGPAASGKSTISRNLAEKLAFCCIDSGALYRAYTYLCQKRFEQDYPSLQAVPEELILQFSHELQLKLFFRSGKQYVHYQGRDLCDTSLRSLDVTKDIAVIADCAGIRKLVNAVIHSVAEDYPIVVDGRDMGTVVFPDADMKFFLYADIEKRVERRLSELREKMKDTKNLNEENIRAGILQRDSEDQNREFGGLRAAEDAVRIDTSNSDIDKVFDTILSEIEKKWLMKISP